MRNEGGGLRPSGARFRAQQSRTRRPTSPSSKVRRSDAARCPPPSPRGSAPSPRGHISAAAPSRRSCCGGILAAAAFLLHSCLAAAACRTRPKGCPAFPRLPRKAAPRSPAPRSSSALCRRLAAGRRLPAGGTRRTVAIADGPQDPNFRRGSDAATAEGRLPRSPPSKRTLLFPCR